MKCMQCVSQYKLDHEDETPDMDAINDAVTEVPVWQLKMAYGQAIFACVMVLVCYEHIEVREKTAEEKATEGGQLLAVPVNGG